MHLGYYARTLGDHEAAQASFARAAELDAGNLFARLELAVGAFRQGRLDEAITRANAVAAENPMQARPLEILANFAEQLDDLEQAVALRRGALDIDGSNQGSHLMLARALARLGRRSEAEAAFAQCERLFGRQPDIEAARANMAREGGDLPLAQAILDQAAATFPDHFELGRQRVAMLTTLGRFEDAQRALATVADPNAREKAQLDLSRGRLAFAQWDMDAAGPDFAAGLQVEAGDAGSHEIAARAALLRLDLDAAQGLLAASVQNNVGHRIHHRGAIKPSQTLVGQILDEFRMDRTALRRLRECRAAEAPATALAALVKSYPDYTPAAIFLLIALRRAGRLSGGPGLRADGAGAPIPATITQYWDDDIPADVEAYCESWREAHPGFSYARFRSRMRGAFWPRRRRRGRSPPSTARSSRR